MKKLTMLCLVVYCMTTFSSLQAQKKYATLFENAYKKYPKIPKNALEALAYVQSRITNLVPEVNMDHHHGPNRYGLFALIEDGENYFRNTLIELSNSTNTSIEKLKTDEAAQILAVAKLMNSWCELHQVTNLEQMDGFFKFFSETPSKTTMDAFAKDQFLYDIYLALTKGVAAEDVTINKSALATDKWFAPSTYKMVSAPFIKIEGDLISNGTEEYKETTTNTPNAAAAVAAVTDYPPALWVASPNYSSRAGTVITAVTIHTTQGSYAGSISWFQNTASQVSAHYLIRSSDGQVTQMVRESIKAWHVGNANPYTIGIEHEGFVNNAAWYTTAMYNSSAALTIDICNDNNIDKTTCYNGPAHLDVVTLSSAIKIKGHQHFPSQNHNDPGINWDWARYYNLINPSAPCNTPTGLITSNIAATDAKLDWIAVSGVASYTLEYKTNASSTYTQVGPIYYNTYTVSGLAGGTTYNWRVRSNCSSNSSAFATAVNFTTLNPCVATTTLNESYIGTSSVNLNWSAVSGATGYILEWKPASATTWTSVTVTNNYTSLFSLSASTSYNWRITTVCASGNSSPSTTQVFSTNASCYDAYETNNVYTVPATYPSLNGGYVYGKICGSGDVDFFKITTTATSNINFSLANMPKNYNIETYTSTGAFLKGGYATGTTNESVVLNNKAAGTYLFKVYGATSIDNDASNDYRLYVTTSAPTIARLAESVAATEPVKGLSIIPNPATDFVNLQFTTTSTDKITIMVKDVSGNIKLQQTKLAVAGIQNTQLNIQNLQNGVYIIQLISNNGLLLTKQLLINK
jgi:N-acetyl-anhydromuramyl-L-alanine amidase AmpD